MLKKFFSDSVIYTIPNLFSRFSGFILLMFYTRFLTPADYGTVELILVLFSLLNLILPLEITQGVARFFSESNSKEKTDIVSTSLWFTFLTFTVPIFLCFLFPEYISQILFKGSLNSNLLILVSVFMLFFALQRLFENQLRWNLQPKEFTLLTIFGSLCLLILPTSAIYFLDLGLLGYIVGALTSSILTSFLGIILVKRYIRIRASFHGETLSKLLSFSAPLVLSSAAFYIFTYSDRWVLQLLESSESVGLYGAASRLASIAAMLHILSRYAFMPLVYANFQNPETSKDIGKIFSFAVLIGGLLSSLIFLFAEEIVGIVLGREFYESSTILGLLSLSILLMNMYFFFPGLSIAKKTKHIAAISIFVAIINLAGNFILIPIFSIKGAAISSFFASLIMVAMYFYFGQKEYQIVINSLKVFIFISLCFAITFIGIFSFKDEIALKIILWAGLLGVTIYLNRELLKELNKLFIESRGE